MAIISKAKIFSNGKIAAGHFIEIDEGPVSINVQGEVRATEFDETATIASFDKDGKAKASELEEY